MYSDSMNGNLGGDMSPLAWNIELSNWAKIHLKLFL